MSKDDLLGRGSTRYARALRFAHAKDGVVSPRQVRLTPDFDSVCSSAKCTGVGISDFSFHQYKSGVPEDELMHTALAGVVGIGPTTRVLETRVIPFHHTPRKMALTRVSAPSTTCAWSR